MAHISFKDWLENWIDGMKESRSFWGAMAHDLRVQLEPYFVEEAEELDPLEIAEILGLKPATAEYWLFNELVMRYLDEKKHFDETERLKDKNLRAFVAQMPEVEKATLLRNKNRVVWHGPWEYLVKQGLIRYDPSALITNVDITKLGYAAIEILEEGTPVDE